MNFRFQWIANFFFNWTNSRLSYGTAAFGHENIIWIINVDWYICMINTIFWIINFLAKRGMFSWKNDLLIRNLFIKHELNWVGESFGRFGLGFFVSYDRHLSLDFLPRISRTPERNVLPIIRLGRSIIKHYHYRALNAWHGNTCRMVVRKSVRNALTLTALNLATLM